MLGIDVSHWNGNLNWPAIKAHGVDFAYIKATEGTTIKDSLFRQHAIGAKQAGVLWGPYHFFRYAVGAKEQAEAFYEQAKLEGYGDLPPVLDLEDKYAPKGSSILIGKMRDTLVEIERLFALKPIVYTAKWWWDPWTNSNKTFGSYPLWVAHYTYAYPSTPTLPTGWTTYAIHQFTDKLNIPNAGDSSIDGNYAPLPLVPGAGITISLSQEVAESLHKALHDAGIG